MPSKGTRRYILRIPDEVADEIDFAIRRRNLWSKEKPWTWSDFARVALVEKLRKMERSRGRKASEATIQLPIAVETEGDYGPLRAVYDDE